MNILPILCDLLMASAVLFSQLAWIQSLNHQVKVIELEKAASGLKTRLKTAQGKTFSAFMIKT